MSILRFVVFVACLMLLALSGQAAEIHTAAHAGDLVRIEALCEQDPAQATSIDDRNCTPLHFAADGGHLAVVTFLLDHGADLESRDVDGDTPLHWAAVAGKNDVCRLLLDRGADLDARNHELFTPLLYAVRGNRHATAELLLDRGADIDAAMDYGRTPLLWVARETGDLPMARLLLQRGANVNAQDTFAATSLNLASWRGFETLVNLLLDHGARVDMGEGQNRQLLHNALYRGLSRLYAALIEAGIPVDIAGDANGGPLHLAAVGGSAEIVADLVARGADLDKADEYGWTPLHYAAAWGRTDVVVELLKHDLNEDARTLSGHSAFGLAERKGARDIVALLADRGVEEAPRRFSALSGPYFGQDLPPDRPELFAPDIVATCLGEHGNITFTPDGREAYWSAHTDVPDSGYVYGTIVWSRLENGRWTEPERAPFAVERGDDCPFVQPDGRRLFFLSRRPLADPEAPRGKENIWMVERSGDSWGLPHPVHCTVNAMPQHWQISVAANGNLYFSSRTGGASTRGIYVSRPVEGVYGRPEYLHLRGHTPFIAPDESYLITTEFGESGAHNMIYFRTATGGWDEPVDLTARFPWLGGLCPMVAMDERAFFFIADRTGENNIHWTGAAWLEQVREESYPKNR